MRKSKQHAVRDEAGLHPDRLLWMGAWCKVDRRWWNPNFIETLLGFDGPEELRLIALNHRLKLREGAGARFIRSRCGDATAAKALQGEPVVLLKIARGDVTVIWRRNWRKVILAEHGREWRLQLLAPDLPMHRYQMPLGQSPDNTTLLSLYNDHLFKDVVAAWHEVFP